MESQNQYLCPKSFKLLLGCSGGDWLALEAGHLGVLVGDKGKKEGTVKGKGVCPWHGKVSGNGGQCVTDGRGAQGGMAPGMTALTAVLQGHWPGQGWGVCTQSLHGVSTGLAVY